MQDPVNHRVFFAFNNRLQERSNRCMISEKLDCALLYN